MLTREVLIYVGLVECPEIDGLITFEVGDADQIAFGDHKALAYSRGHADSLSDRHWSSHVAPFILLLVDHTYSRSGIPSRTPSRGSIGSSLIVDCINESIGSSRGTEDAASLAH